MSKMNKKTSNSIRSSNDNPLNSSFLPSNHLYHQVPNETNIQQHTKTIFGQTRRAKLGVPELNETQLANRKQYINDLNQQIEYKNKLKRELNEQNGDHNVQRSFLSTDNSYTNGLRGSVKYEPQHKTKDNNQIDLLLESQARKQKEEKYNQFKNVDHTSYFDRAFGNNPRPIATLTHTDVTKQKLMHLESERRADQSTYRVYHEELAKQIEEKERMKKIEKLQLAIADEQHHRQFSNYFGRGGAGAPTTDSRRKDLMGALMSPRYNEDGLNSEMQSVRINY